MQSTNIWSVPCLLWQQTLLALPLKLASPAREWKYVVTEVSWGVSMYTANLTILHTVLYTTTLYMLCLDAYASAAGASTSRVQVRDKESCDYTHTNSRYSQWWTFTNKWWFPYVPSFHVVCVKHLSFKWVIINIWSLWQDSSCLEGKFPKCNNNMTCNMYTYMHNSRTCYEHIENIIRALDFFCGSRIACTFWGDSFSNVCLRLEPGASSLDLREKPSEAAHFALLRIASHCYCRLCRLQLCIATQKVVSNIWIIWLNMLSRMELPTPTALESHANVGGLMSMHITSGTIRVLRSAIARWNPTWSQSATYLAQGALRHLKTIIYE